MHCTRQCEPIPHVPEGRLELRNFRWQQHLTLAYASRTSCCAQAPRVASDSQHTSEFSTTCLSRSSFFLHTATHNSKITRTGDMPRAKRARLDRSVTPHKNSVDTRSDSEQSDSGIRKKVRWGRTSNTAEEASEPSDSEEDSNLEKVSSSQGFLSTRH